MTIDDSTVRSQPRNAEPIRCRQTGTTILYHPDSDTITVRCRRYGRTVTATYQWAQLESARKRRKIRM